MTWDQRKCCIKHDGSSFCFLIFFRKGKSFLDARKPNYNKRRQAHKSPVAASPLEILNLHAYVKCLRIPNKARFIIVSKLSYFNVGHQGNFRLHVCKKRKELLNHSEINCRSTASFS